MDEARRRQCHPWRPSATSRARTAWGRRSFLICSYGHDRVLAPPRLLVCAPVHPRVLVFLGVLLVTHVSMLVCFLSLFLLMWVLVVTHVSMLVCFLSLFLLMWVLVVIHVSMLLCFLSLFLLMWVLVVIHVSMPWIAAVLVLVHSM